MRIIYKTFTGKKQQVNFSSWSQMCSWLKTYYPFVVAASELGEWLDNH